MGNGINLYTAKIRIENFFKTTYLLWNPEMCGEKTFMCVISRKRNVASNLALFWETKLAAYSYILSNVKS